MVFTLKIIQQQYFCLLFLNFFKKFIHNRRDLEFLLGGCDEIGRNTWGGCGKVIT